MNENQARAQAAALSEAVATNADIQDVKVLILETNSSNLKWIFSMLLGQAALIAALVKLL